MLVSAATAAFPLTALPAEAVVGGDRVIEVFTGSNLIGLTNYPANTDVTVEVVRQGFVIGSATKTTDADGVIELNHIGAEANDCFDGPTSPDVMPEDTIRTTFGTTVDTSTVRGVWIDDIAYGATTITVSGRVSLGGADQVVPGSDVLELRINKDAVWEENDRPGRRDRREDIGASVDPDGTWTHVINATAADVSDAQAGSETFLEWSPGGGAADPQELTVAEFGPGEGLPGCPPLQVGPTAPQLNRAMDTAKSGDHVTRRAANLTFRGLTGEAGPGAEVTLFVDGGQRAVATANDDGVYRFSGVDLAARNRPYSLMVRAQSEGAPFFESTVRTVRVDQTRPRVIERSLRPKPLHLRGPERMRAVYRIGEASTLRAKVQQRGPARTRRTFPVRSVRRPGLTAYNWNGKNMILRDVQPGKYRIVLTVTDAAGNRSRSIQPFRVVR